MVMSGSGESVVFVHDRPGDESLLTGGTIARLRADGADVVVLFGAGSHDDSSEDAGEDAGVRVAMGRLGVRDWRILPGPAATTTPGEDPSPEALAALAEVLLEVGATALVLGTDDARLQRTATVAAHTAGIPVFQSRRVSGAIGQRLIAIDVSDQIEQKLAAVAAYPGRWRVAGQSVGPAARPDGTVPIGGPAGTPADTVVSGTETYLRILPPAARAIAGPRPGPGARALAGLLAFTVGATFGVVGTIAHQATILIGPLTVPIGLVLALAGVTALLAGLRLVVGDRLIVLLAAIGLLGTIFLLSLRSQGGSVLVPAGLPGTLWSVGPTLVATIVLAWPRIPAGRGSA